MFASSHEIDQKHKIFCNRTLNMKHIKAIGFDMDYTLSLYKTDTFEVLAYAETLKKLVQLGYPKEIIDFQFDWNFMIRGLLIDKVRGNVLKLDRHKYVKVAFHGFKQLTREERRNLYDTTLGRSYQEPDFTPIDTLFSLADAYLFSQLVELRDANPERVRKTYREIFDDIRSSIDLCHRDGSIKNHVSRNPEHFIVPTPHLLETLTILKRSGRKLFMLTNSLWDYTNVVMNHLTGNAPSALTLDWLNLFDVVIVGSSKPNFFVSNPSMFEVIPESGHLRNITGPIAPGTKVFQGGSFHLLHKLLDIRAGSEILYIGDHIYGDILRSKKDIGWRTLLVIEELEREIEVLTTNRDLLARIDGIMRTKENIEDRIQNLISDLASLTDSRDDDTSDQDPDIVALREQIRSLADNRDTVRETLRDLSREFHGKFHPRWGQLMKTGHQNSRFAQQVEGYACIYTSTLSNLRFVPPSKAFQSTRDSMPHEF